MQLRSGVVREPLSAERIAALSSAERAELAALWFDDPGGSGRRIISETPLLAAFLSAPIKGDSAAALLAFLLGQGAAGARALGALNAAIQRAAAELSLVESQSLLDGLWRRGAYERWVRDGPEAAAPLGRALMRVRPPPAREAAINRRLDQGAEPGPGGAACLVVPGHSEPGGPALTATARRRCRLAYARFLAGDAPRIICSGGALDPAAPEAFEGLAMRDELLRLGAPEERVGVELRARHTTTNLRNVARLMLRRGWRSAVVVTTPLQALYLAAAGWSGFGKRCRRELGYLPGQLRRLDRHRCRFEPAEETRRVNERDPLDP